MQLLSISERCVDYNRLTTIMFDRLIDEYDVFDYNFKAVLSVAIGRIVLQCIIKELKAKKNSRNAGTHNR